MSKQEPMRNICDHQVRMINKSTIRTCPGEEHLYEVQYRTFLSSKWSHKQTLCGHHQSLFVVRMNGIGAETSVKQIGTYTDESYGAVTQWGGPPKCDGCQLEARVNQIKGGWECPVCEQSLALCKCDCETDHAKYNEANKEATKIKETV